MKNDGRALEKLVAYVEKTLSKEGLHVDVNQKLYNDDGVQIAEFDVTVNGLLGTSKVSWLIECRNRPSSGKAPAEWIYSLYGKRTVHQFDKVTAVSTTGFSPGAISAASKLNVELREVAETTPEALNSWLNLAEVELVQHDIALADIDLIVDKSHVNPERKRYLEQLASSPDSRKNVVLIRGDSNYKLDLHTACREALALADGFNAISPENSPIGMDMIVEYEAEDSRLYLETPEGKIRLRRIRYRGSVSSVLKRFLVVEHSIYREFCNGEPIAQTASAHIPLPSGEVLSLTFTKVKDQEKYQVNWQTTR